MQSIHGQPHQGQLQKIYYDKKGAAKYFVKSKRGLAKYIIVFSTFVFRKLLFYIYPFTGVTLRRNKMNMQVELKKNASNNVAKWLFAGVIMLMVQILLGGITRLTESGLSITEWKPITGTLPPLNTTQWMEEFNKYNHTDQFRYLNSSFFLSDFNFLFFWEWFHRAWARLMGLVFLI